MKNFVDLVDEVFTDGTQRGVMQLSTQDDFINGKTVRIHNQEMLNFGSCSYLGMEVDQRLKYGAIDAINRFGTQFSASRSYISLGIYDELEDLLSQIFQQPTIAAPTTSLGHITVLPNIINEKDLVIKDKQVHASVQNTLRILKAQGVTVRSVPHNDMEILEQEIEQAQKKYRHIWYMADGVYSMYGDGMPVPAIQRLLDEYEQFHVYVDDAHGMSWTGPRGAGYVFDKMNFHPRMVMATSLAKGFASGGGALVFPNEAMKKKIRNCGAGVMFSGPIQPAVMGASVASAKIHLSPEIQPLQEELQAKMRFFQETTRKYDLRLIHDSFTPIFFIGVGKLEVGFNLLNRMMKAGFFTNLGLYPAVPYKNTGMRVALNRSLAYSDIDAMLAVMAEELEYALRDEGSSKEEMLEAFGLEPKMAELSR